MKNHLLEKLHPNSTGGTPLNIFKIPKNQTERKIRGFEDLEGGKMKKKSNFLVAHHLLGAPLVAEKKLVSNFFFGKNVQNMIRNMTGKFEIFSVSPSRS